MSDQSIGIFDSGVGGLTVLRALRAALPHESVLYLGDTARLPYGNKSGETVVRFSLENSFYLTQKGIKLLVVACNTASAFALDRLKKALPIPVIGVIQPSVAAAAARSTSQHIAVLGTRGTIQSGAYQREILKVLPRAIIYPIACPLFVPLVEEDFIAHPAADLVVEEYLAQLKDTPIDTVILGCTHYPLLCERIQRVLGPHVHIVDSAASCADEVRHLLCSKLLNFTQNLAKEQFLVTDDPDSFQRMGSKILGRQILSVDKVSTAACG